MALVLKVNGVDRSSYVKWDTLVKTEVLTKEVDRMEFEVVKTPAKATLPAVNDEVTLEENSVKIFGGIIVERNEKIKGGLLIGYEYRCKDYSQYLDRKLVLKSYENQTARAIFLDILSTYTTGFTTTNIPTSTPTIKSIKFNYDQVTRCFAKICDLIGWDWYVDYDKDIHLFAEDTNLAPFSITDENDKMEWASLEINNTILQLKNSVRVRGGDRKQSYDATDTPDVYIADGTQQTFFLAYQYSAIQVTDNGAGITVGTDQQDDPGTVDAVYNFNEKFVRFTVAPTAGHTIKMFGDALIPIIGLVRDNPSVATYGEYQAIVVDKTITSTEEAYARANAELAKYSQSVYEGQFKTTQTGLKTGQRITISSDVREFYKNFKINRIVGKARSYDAMEYTISIVASGQVNFTDIMVQLLTQQTQNIEVAQDEVLQQLEYFLESEINISDTINTPTTQSGPYLYDAVGSNPSGVVISQIYSAGGILGALYQNDFIELHNRGTSPVSLTNWSIQYTSVTGSVFAKQNLSGSIAAGGYILIKCNSSGAVGSLLPTEDFTFAVGMSTSGGRVYLCNSTTLLSGTAPVSAAIQDKVGYGATATDYETAPAGALSAVTALVRNNGGCTDAGNNSTDFSVTTPNPRNSSSPVQICVSGSPSKYNLAVYG